MPQQTDIKDAIAELLAKAGLELLGILPLDQEEDLSFYQSWLKENRHGEMKYLEENLSCRKNPRQILEEAKSVICFGYPYYLGDQWPTIKVGASAPQIAQYARFRDYHKTLKKKGEGVWLSLATKLKLPDTTKFRVVTDSIPILERSLSARAGFGFVGKNTCVIHPEKGSFFLLGEIFTSLDIKTYQKAMPEPSLRTKEGGCGTCRRCQVHCPTGALSQDYQIDARKCLSYWSIEHRGTIPEEFWPYFRWYFFGCDICQLVCPYNRGLKTNQQSPDYYLKNPPPLKEIALMSQAQYETWFGGTPLTRAKRSGLRRNSLIALYVTKSTDLAMVMNEVQNDSEPVIVETLRQIKKLQENP